MIVQAAVNLTRPGVDCYAEGNEVADLVWRDKDVSKPSDSALQAEVTRLQAAIDANQYQRDRAEAYPSLQDQADMQFHDAVDGTTTWQDAIQAVKDANPKP